MGKAALEGLPGIERVTRGFKDGREINTVAYDPQLISVERMIEALKKAETYGGQVQ